MLSYIKKELELALNNLEEEQKLWIKNHLVEPKEILVYKDFNMKQKETFLLITDDTGYKDSSYRIIFCPRENKFGLEMTTNEGNSILIGVYGSFFDAFLSM